MLFRAIIMIVATATLLGCDDIDNKYLEAAVKWNRFGKSADHWLELKNLDGDWERVALVFGYWDDYEACKDILNFWQVSLGVNIGASQPTEG